MALVDFFTPGNEANLNTNDDDLSGSGFTLLPDTNLLLGGGKEGVLYLIDAAKNLGGKVVNDTQVVQKFNVNGGHVMGGPVFWNSPTSGALVYNWAEDDVLKAYQLGGGRLVTTPYMQGQVVSPGHPGGAFRPYPRTAPLRAPASSGPDADDPGWHSRPRCRNVRAYDADTLREIWSSEQNASRDRVGTLMKFVPPVVVNGRVYLPNQDNQVVAYGLLPQNFTISVTPGAQVLRPGATGIFSVSVGAVGAVSGSVNLSASGLPGRNDCDLRSTIHRRSGRRHDDGQNSGEWTPRGHFRLP